jgi:hypothetical protein
MNHNPRFAKPFITLISVAGFGSLVYAATHATTWHPFEAFALLAIAVAASRMNMKLPGLTSNMSVNLPFLLLAAAELNLVEALTVTCLATTVQCLPKDGGKLKRERLLFNLSLMSFAVALTWQVCRLGAVPHLDWLSSALVLPLAALTLFLMQTVPVSVVIDLTDGGSVPAVWSKLAHLTFPNYLLSAGVVSMVVAARHHVGWQLPLLVLPVMYGTYRSYQTYFGREAAVQLPISLGRAAGAGH